MTTTKEKIEMEEVKFTASNDLTIMTTPDSQTRILDKRGYNRLSDFDFLSDRDLVAVKEFLEHTKPSAEKLPFQHNGYWVIRRPSRDNENGRCLLVVNPETGESWVTFEETVWWESASSSKESGWILAEAAAVAWFKANPFVRWHHAEIGEVWRVTIDGHTEDTICCPDVGGRFEKLFNGVKLCIAIDDPSIINAEKMKVVGNVK